MIPRHFIKPIIDAESQAAIEEAESIVRGFQRFYGIPEPLDAAAMVAEAEAIILEVSTQ